MGENDMLFDSEDVTLESVPQIYNYFSKLGDDPTKHRWRATWEREFNTSMPVGIRLDAYPVVSLTEFGAWIAPYASYMSGEWEFHSDSPHKRLVMNGSGSSWAKLTQEEALNSLAYRLKRWAQKTRREMNAVERAVAVANVLLPNRQHDISEATRWL